MDRQLIEYLPDVMRDYKEIEAITDAEQPEIENLWDDCDLVVENSFISDEDETSAARWESILGISPKDSDTLKVRNYRILTRTQNDLPYSYRGLLRILTAITMTEGEYNVTVDEDNYSVDIKVALTSTGLLSEVEEAAERNVPANMILTVGLMYATYGQMASLTHGEMAAYTQEELIWIDFR